MGMYDDVVVKEKNGQVKLWHCEMSAYRDGDKVPDTIGKHTYSIAMREGGFLNIHDLILESWTDEPKYSPLYDKWGAPFTADSEGLLPGEGYAYSPKGE